MRLKKYANNPILSPNPNNPPSTVNERSFAFFDNL